MQTNRTAHLATMIVIGTGILWGFYWLPVRRLAGLGLSGAWSSLAIVAMAALLLTPLAWRNRRRLAGADRAALGFVALGGAAFVLYSVALVYGRVAIIILLFFLTPVWSTLLGRIVMRWPTPRLRLLAILTGLAGLGLMLGAGGEAPLPRGAGEWMALISGLLWAVATTGIRARPALPPADAAFVFACGACAGGALLVPLLAATPALAAASGGHVPLIPALIWATLAGGLWWGLSMGGLMWAAARLEPARVGILLMSEVLVGALSAALLAGEHLGPLELSGGALVLLAGVLEVWPVRPRPERGTA